MNKIIGRRIGKITIVAREVKPLRYLAKCDCGHEMIPLTKSSIAWLMARDAKGMTVECGMCQKARREKELAIETRRKAEEFKRWQEQQSELLFNPSTSINDVDFSNRTYNCLRKAGFDTLGKIASASDETLLSIRTFGSKSLAEVREMTKLVKCAS